MWRDACHGPVAEGRTAYVRGVLLRLTAADEAPTKGLAGCIALRISNIRVIFMAPPHDLFEPVWV